MNFVSRAVWKIRSRLKIAQKSLDGRGWIVRWDAACSRCWRILSGEPAALERFHRFVRNHRRLCRLSEAKRLAAAAKADLKHPRYLRIVNCQIELLPETVLPVLAPGEPLAERSAPVLSLYDKFIVAFSGGKDSLACVLHLLESGVPKEKIELWHHEIDGREGSTLMDWGSTPAYCRKVAKELGVAYFSSWKSGGFEREMLRDNAPTAPAHFEMPDGSVLTAGGTSGKLGTRLKFPQTSADLSVRWCSAYLKIDVFCIAFRNQDRFRNLKTLVLSGERAQESSCRAKYKPFERHRTDARDGALARHVDAWRPVHQWSEADVWAIIQRFKISPHCGYRLGFGRLSCARCIFGSPNQWASARVVCPSAVAKIAAYEKQFGVTIDRKLDVQAKADKGTPYPATANQDLIDEANDPNWDGPVFVDDWQMPAGAFGENTGPT